jgi:hypothetical protein
MIRYNASSRRRQGAAGAARWLAVGLGLLGGVGVPPLPALGAGPGGIAEEQRPRTWTDDATGYALGGFDPVDYYVLGAARAPAANAGVELFWGGVSWRFRNEGNRDAFVLNPSIYCPRYSGLDPVKLAEGLVVQAEPIHFDIFHNRLYLFHNAANLAVWRADRERLLEAADLHWPLIAREFGYEIAAPVDPKPLTPPPPAEAAAVETLPGGMSADGALIMPGPPQSAAPDRPGGQPDQPPSEHAP